MPPTKLSKFLSLVLRHRPEQIGLRLDEAGWANIAELIEVANKAGMSLTPAVISHIVKTNDKQRFTISYDGARIRANQGHSILVDLGLSESEPPEFLYHGTARRNIAALRNSGIVKGKRMYVHLSLNREMATMVGKRHGAPIVLAVQAFQMYRDGLIFYLSENGIWMTESVAPKYIDWPDH